MDNANQQVPPISDQSEIKTANNLSFFKTLAYGFVIVSIGISIAVGGYLLGTNKTKPQPIAQISMTPSVSFTPDPTANWKTYTTNVFSIKYPSTWSDPAINKMSTKVNYEFLPANLNITVGFNYDQDLQRAKTFEDESKSAGNFAIGKREVMAGDSINATSYIYSIGASTKEENVLLKGKGDNIIWLRMPFPPGTDVSVFDQILSTFKFTDQNQATDTGLKTYENNIFRFSLKYPEDWELSEKNIENRSSSVLIGQLGTELPGNVTGNKIYANSITIEVDSNLNNYSLEDWIKLKENNPTETKFTFINNMLVAGQQAQRGAFGCCMTYKETIFFKKSNFLFQITGGNLGVSKKDKYSYEEIFNQILSTLKFI